MMPKPYNISPPLKQILKIPLILLLILSILYTYDSIRWTPPVPGGIAELAPITVNGQQQWLLIRGRNKNAPVLLFLHGESAQISIMRPYQKLLEEKFIVVQWDQRGSGLSGNPFPEASALTVPQLVEDGLTLTRYLKEKFNQEKIYLAGHGRGTALGWLLARDYPEHFQAYAALSQFAASNQEAVSYSSALSAAQSLGNKELASNLESIGPPPWAPAKKNAALLKSGIRQLRGNIYKGDIQKIFARLLLLSPEYRLSDAIDWRENKKKSFPTFSQNIDLAGGGKDFKIPFYMILGENDLITPMEPAAELYETITAPNKKLLIYKECAHYIMWERTYDYQAALIRLFGVH